jgi:hypothetical protein
MRNKARFWKYRQTKKASYQKQGLVHVYGPIHAPEEDESDTRRQYTRRSRTSNFE